MKQDLISDSISQPRLPPQCQVRQQALPRVDDRREMAGGPEGPFRPERYRSFRRLGLELAMGVSGSLFLDKAEKGKRRGLPALGWTEG